MSSSDSSVTVAGIVVAGKLTGEKSLFVSFFKIKK